jgi:large subunit ribosomal protein L24
MQRIKKGDTVQVIAGKDLGERGEVIGVYPKENRVAVQGVNMLKKHQKARQAGGQQVPSQIIDFEGKMDLSNVMLVCPTCDQNTRVGFKVREDGSKVRVCKKCNAEFK